jgi:acetolactate synthase I/II/III large subunit
MTVTGGEILLDALRANHIEVIFCSPGSEWVCLLDALARHYSHGEKSPAYINCRHETLAVSMAMGYAKVTGRVPALLLHNSVGPLHAAMAIRAAYHAGDPLLICAGDVSGKGDYEADPETGWTWASRLGDVGGIDSLVKGYVKWCRRADSAQDIPRSVNEACRVACTPPAGPVFLAVPWQTLVTKQEAPNGSCLLPFVRPIEPGPEGFHHGARILIESEQPVMITEYGARKAQTVSALVRLSELLAAPVLEMVDPALSNFPPEHPLYMGDRASAALAEADAILIVGANTPWYPPQAYIKKNARVILLDEDADKTRMPHWPYRTDVKLGGDMHKNLTSLTDTISVLLGDSKEIASRFSTRFEKWRQEHQEMAAAWQTEGLEQEKNETLTPKGFFYRLHKIFPKDALILDETVSQGPLIRRYLGTPGHYIRAGAGGLGIGLGVAAGVKLANRNRPVIFFVGDGTFVYNPVPAALEACREYHLPMLTVLFNNGGYGAIRNAYHRFCPQGWSVSNNTYIGVNFKPQPDYVKVAEAHGAFGERITEPSAVEPSFIRALDHLAQGRSYLLDVIFP